MAHLTADRYVSAENGDDAQNGSTEALAWATVDKAASDAVAGETVAIAPGTYRETVVVDNAGLSGSEIIFRGDPECLYFDDEYPGRVRITDTNSSEEAQYSAEGITSKQDYVEWHKIWTDGAVEGIDFGSSYSTSRIIYDSVVFGQGNNAAIYQGSATRCTLWGRRGANATRTINCIAIGAAVGYRRPQAHNCLAIGGNLGFDMANDANAYVNNCVALGSITGFSDPAGADDIDSCLAVACENAASTVGAGEATNCYYYGCFAVGDADFGTEGVTTFFNWSALADLLPWLAVNAAGGILRQGDNTGPGFGAADVDISGHRLRLKGDAVDIGPWSISAPTEFPYAVTGPGRLNWGVFHTHAPSRWITTEGDDILQIKGQADVLTTVTCWVRHNSLVAGDSLPQVLLEGDSITNQSVTHTGAENVWRQLSVAARPAINEVLTVIFRARNTTGACYFSDLVIS